MFDTTPDGIEKLIAEGESETVEFKYVLPRGDDIARIFVSFANTEGGILLVGVNKRGEISGVPNSYIEGTLYHLRKITSSVLPYAVESGVVEIRGKKIIYAAIDKAPSHLSPVMTSRGEVYKREHTSIVLEKQNTYDWFAHLRPRLEQHRKEVQVFVAMSFHNEEEPALIDYYRAIERAVKETDLPIALNRVDLVEGDYEISQRIMDEIDKADIVISDFTLNSRNVYFELGYARGTKKRIIQSARKGTELEFDIKTWRTLFYRNATELEEKLIPALTTAYAEVTADDAS